MNVQKPEPPLPGDELKQSRNGIWFAYGKRDLRELFKGKNDLVGNPYVDYTDEEAACIAAYRWYPHYQEWSLWNTYTANYIPICHELEGWETA